MPRLDEATLLAFRDELRKEEEASRELQDRFSKITGLLGEHGVTAGTSHKRLLIPYNTLSQKDLIDLGFKKTPGFAAVPERGQPGFSSYRHPDMNYHLHPHKEGWTIHEDAASTTSGVGSLLSHAVRDAAPAYAVFARDVAIRAPSLAKRVLRAEPPAVRKEIKALAPSLQKEGGLGEFVARHADRLRNVGGAAGVGMLGGLGTGAVVGGVHGYRQARQQGAGFGQSLASGAAGSLQGATKGTMIGGALGAGAGAVMNPGTMAAFGERNGVFNAASRFGQRQMHGFTGMLSPEQLASESVRGGVYDARKAVETAATPALQARAQKALQAREAVSGIGANSSDLSNIPGAAKSMWHAPLRTMGQAVREQVANPNLMTIGMVGAPVAIGAYQAMGPAVDKEGRTRGERIGRAVGDTAGFMMGGTMPIVAGGEIMKRTSQLGGAVGRGVDRLRGVRPPPRMGAPGMSPTTLPDQSEGQHLPVERVTSPAAAGRATDVGI
jgi:hypothetical protein